ncbi:F-box domain containing protein [Pandoravirus quercus]|uniref:F-box domain containing protein n=1 Tax=Pandoravirus quercus TaxID=2107709 RepID=A0A2U7U9Q7_9VIRU|nr:F-box domain containing protein [Pandoravirus quercus]AVK75110.1 F-box domain containing protein [Pandoravirus quercus]
MATTLFDLPDEILVCIVALTRPSARRAAQLATVCSRLCRVTADDGVWKGVFRRSVHAAPGFDLPRPDARNAAGHLLSWRKLAQRLAQTKVDARILVFPKDMYDPAVSSYHDDGISTCNLRDAMTSTRLAHVVLGQRMYPMSYFTVWLADVITSNATAGDSPDKRSRLVGARLLRVLRAHGPHVASAEPPWWWADWSTACTHKRPRLSITCMFAHTKKHKSIWVN